MARSEAAATITRSTVIDDIVAAIIMSSWLQDSSFIPSLPNKKIGEAGDEVSVTQLSRDNGV